MPAVRPPGSQVGKLSHKKGLGKARRQVRPQTTNPGTTRPQGTPSPKQTEKPSGSGQSLAESLRQLGPSLQQPPQSNPPASGQMPPSDPEDGAPTPPSAPPEKSEKPLDFNDPFNPPQMWCPPANWTPPKPFDPSKIDPNRKPIDMKDWDPLKPPKNLPPGTLWS